MLEKEEAAEARRKAPTVTDLVEEYVERRACGLIGGFRFGLRCGTSRMTS